MCIPGLCVFVQGLKKSEGSGDKMQHLLKIREQSIQTLQQEMKVRVESAQHILGYY